VPSIPFYSDPIAESVLRMGPSGGELALVSTTAHVSAQVENQFDDQTSVGKNFARVRFVGVKPAKFTATFVVLPEDERDFYAKVVPLLRQKGKNASAPPMSVVNPQINRLGVNVVSVLSADIDPPDPRDGRAVTLHLREWTPAPVKPKAADTSGVTNRDPLNLNPAATAKNQ
jgi:hypothetical protein